MSTGTASARGGRIADAIARFGTPEAAAATAAVTGITARKGVVTALMRRADVAPSVLFDTVRTFPLKPRMTWALSANATGAPLRGLFDGLDPAALTSALASWFTAEGATALPPELIDEVVRHSPGSAVSVLAFCDELEESRIAELVAVAAAAAVESGISANNPITDAARALLLRRVLAHAPRGPLRAAALDAVAGSEWASCEVLDEWLAWQAPELLEDGDLGAVQRIAGAAVTALPWRVYAVAHRHVPELEAAARRGLLDSYEVAELLDLVAPCDTTVALGSAHNWSGSTPVATLFELANSQTETDHDRFVELAASVSPVRLEPRFSVGAVLGAALVQFTSNPAVSDANLEAVARRAAHWPTLRGPVLDGLLAREGGAGGAVWARLASCNERAVSVAILEVATDPIDAARHYLNVATSSTAVRELVDAGLWRPDMVELIQCEDAAAELARSQGAVAKAIAAWASELIGGSSRTASLLFELLGDHPGTLGDVALAVRSCEA